MAGLIIVGVIKMDRAAISNHSRSVHPFSCARRGSNISREIDVTRRTHCLIVPRRWTMYFVLDLFRKSSRKLPLLVSRHSREARQTRSRIEN